MIKEKNIIFIAISSLLFFSLLYFPNLLISPDTKTFTRVGSSIVSFSSLFSPTVMEEPQYLMTYLIFKFILLFDNFEFTFKIINFFSFLIIVIFSQKILLFYKINFKTKFDYLFFLFLYFYNFEILQWTYYGLTDLILVALILMAIYYFLTGNIPVTILIFIFSILIKPQSIFILFLVAFIYINRLNYKKYLFFYLYILFYILIFFSTFLINKYGENIFILNTIAKYTHWIFLKKLFEGIIIDDRIFIEYENFFSIVKIYFLRFVNFYSIYFEEFSLRHRLYKISYFFVLYAPILFFIFKRNYVNKEFIEFSIGSIIIVSLFFVLTIIDYDLRYRLYVYPFLIMLSSYCFQKIYAQK